PRHAVDDLLDVGGDDVLTAEDDEVLEPAGHVEESLGVEGSQIARAQPAVGHEHPLRGGRVVVVDLHDARALPTDVSFHDTPPPTPAARSPVPSSSGARMRTETPRHGWPTERKRPLGSSRSGNPRGQMATASVASARP